MGSIPSLINEQDLIVRPYNYYEDFKQFLPLFDL